MSGGRKTSGYLTGSRSTGQSYTLKIVVKSYIGSQLQLQNILYFFFFLSRLDSVKIVMKWNKLSEKSIAKLSIIESVKNCFSYLILHYVINI